MKSVIAEEISRIVPTGRLYFNEPMSRHTSFRIGGDADIMADIESEREAEQVLLTCRRLGVFCLPMGNGTNLLVRDGGIRGVVMKMQKYFCEVSIQGETVRAQAGALLSRLSRQCANYGLGGLEFACGIPGTVGGAVLINAGAYGSEMKDVLKSVRVIENGRICEKNVFPSEMGYRTSMFNGNGCVVLSADFNLYRQGRCECERRIAELMEKRNRKQPVDIPSAGSAFKRPANGYASELIDRAGLKGLRVGGAEVSCKHAGFIVNTGGASAKDVVMLMEIIKARVFEAFGVKLESEIMIVGCD